MVNLVESGIMEGDEIGIFDGDICVGSAQIRNLQKANNNLNSISIPVSANDGIEQTNGFTTGNSIKMRLYRNGMEYPLTLQPINQSKLDFKKGESLFAMMDLTTGLEERIAGTNQPEINCYPNPFSDEVIIEIKLVKDSELQVEVLNQLGQTVKYIISKQFINEGLHKFVWNGTNQNNQIVSPGMYYLIVKENNSVFHQKIVFSK
jgi:hypothetical protein